MHYKGDLHTTSIKLISKGFLYPEYSLASPKYAWYIKLVRGTLHNVLITNERGRFVIFVM